MGNTKTYYIEGELRQGVTLEEFKKVCANAMHYTYCVAEIVEKEGGYLGCSGNKSGTSEDRGSYLVAAIHSYSMRADMGAMDLVELFIKGWFRMHRLDSDWSDVWCVAYNEAGELIEYRTEGLVWQRLE